MLAVPLDFLGRRRRIRSCGCCRCRRTRFSVCCASSRHPRGCSRTRVRTSGTRSPRRRTSVSSRRPRRRCSTRSSTSPRRRSPRSWCRGPRSSRISVEMPPEEALRAVVDSPFTRYPVYRGSLDEIVGILHVRDLFGAIHDLGIAVRRARVDRPPCVRRTGDEGPRRAPRRLPAREAAHGDRGRRVRRRWRASSRSRTCSRRSWAR